jgi:hypothetical protein
MKFNVTIPCKRYVKRFLENNYGNPVNFSKHPRENEMFRRMLKKPCKDQDRFYKKELSLHTVFIEVEISERDFYRHGWEVSKTDIVSFGKHFEKNAKWLMRTVVSTYASFGIPIHIAIYKFQLRFHMEEDYWPFDAIKQDFYRLRGNKGLDLNEYAYEHIERLIKINMEYAGVLVGNAAKNTDNNLSDSQ